MEKPFTHPQDVGTPAFESLLFDIDNQDLTIRELRKLLNRDHHYRKAFDAIQAMNKEAKK